MITAQEIREKTFEKSFNGYNMSQVDEFLDQLVADISAIVKENASLKGKMRVLVEKVEEYRQTEDSMRLALLSAQKMGAQIEAEAKERADATVAEAKDTADQIRRRAADSIANEKAKLEEAKKATDKFFDHMRTVCQKQLEFYEKLSNMQLVGAAPTEVAALEVAPGTAKKSAAPKPKQKKLREGEADRSARAVASPKPAAKLPSARQVPAKAAAAPTDEDDEDVDDIDLADVDLEEETAEELPVELAEEEEPTRRFGESAPRKKRDYGEFRFSDEF